MKFKLIYSIACLITATSCLASEKSNTPDEHDSASSKETVRSFTVAMELDEYLNSTENPKLLLCCGHNFDHHEHKGWYTIDINPKLHPDVTGDLDKEETQRYIFKPDTYNLITEEHMSYCHQTLAFLKAVAKSLKKGGAFVFTTPVCNFSDDFNLISFEQHYYFGMNELWMNALKSGEGLNENGEKIIDIVITVNSLLYLENHIRPFFKEMGFSDVKLCVSYSSISDLETLLEDFTSLTVSGATTTTQDLKAYGPNPEAAKLDEYFRSVSFGKYYVIATK